MSVFGYVITLVSTVILSIFGGYSLFNSIDEDDRKARIFSFIAFMFCAITVTAHIMCLIALIDLGGLS